MQDSLNILLAPCTDYSEDFIEHHGVLGMKWGVRRQQRREARNERRRQLLERYRTNLRTDDLNAARKKYGRRGIKRISKNVDKGYTTEEARTMEERRKKFHRKMAKTVIKLGVAAGAVYAGNAISLGPTIVNGFKAFVNPSLINVGAYEISKARTTAKLMAKLP